MGKYQVLLVTALCILSLQCGGLDLMTPFLFYQDPYSCEGLSSKDCKDMVCDLPYDQRKAYIPMETTIKSFANKFGEDYRCP